MSAAATAERSERTRTGVEASAQVMVRLGMSYRGIEHWYDQDLALYAMTQSDGQSSTDHSE